MLLPSWGYTTRNLVLLLVVAASILLVGCETGRSSTSTPTPTSESEKRTPTAAVPPTASPTGAQSPTASLSPTAAPSIAVERNPEPTLAAPSFDPLPIPPERDLYELARSLFKIGEEMPRVVNPDLVSLEQGRVDSFWLTDAISKDVFSIDATLRLVSDHAYWYVESRLGVSDEDLERAAREFEESTYPKITSAFGTEWVPGVDNDPRITILTANIPGLGGYYSSMDEYPTFVHQFSNQREMVYISGSIPVGSRGHSGVLAHELHHAVLWNADPSEETWVAEGLAEYAAQEAGFHTGHQPALLGNPTASLVNWPVSGGRTVYYAAGYLFFRYFASHYSQGDLRPLMTQPLDGIDGINAYLTDLGYTETFDEIFGDWTVANYLDLADGKYGYPQDEFDPPRPRRINDYEAFESSLPQYAAEYFAVDITRGDVTIDFEGERHASLLAVNDPEVSCWWSNRGDSISSTLTRRLDLSGVDEATLEYRVWFGIEEGWDYGYLQVSTDNGKTWDIIEAPGTSPANPVGNSFGPGYTGFSGRWLDETVDLGAYAGKQVLLRFHYVTDAALNGIGLCVDDVSVPQIGFYDDGAQGDNGWEAEGFVLTDNRVPQSFAVYAIEIGADAKVTKIDLDDANRGSLNVSRLEDLAELVIVVAAMAPAAIDRAHYSLALSQAP